VQKTCQPIISGLWAPIKHSSFFNAMWAERNKKIIIPAVATLGLGFAVYKYFSLYKENARLVKVADDALKKQGAAEQKSRKEYLDLDKLYIAARDRAYDLSLKIENLPKEASEFVVNAIFHKPDEYCEADDGTLHLISYDYQRESFYTRLNDVQKEYYDTIIQRARDEQKTRINEAKKVCQKKDQVIDVLAKDFTNTTTILPLFSALIFSNNIRGEKDIKTIQNKLTTELNNSEVWNKITVKDIIIGQLAAVAQRVTQNREDDIAHAVEEKNTECKGLKEDLQIQLANWQHQIKESNEKLLNESIRAENAERSVEKLIQENSILSEKVRRYEKNPFTMKNSPMTDSVSIEVNDVVVVGQEKNEKPAKVSTKPHGFGKPNQNGIQIPRTQSNENVYYS
jgi:hypothetical protein